MMAMTAQLFLIASQGIQLRAPPRARAESPLAMGRILSAGRGD